MNNDDFWTNLATGHTNTVLAGSMDAHLSGKTIDESFGTVRTLVGKTAAALPQPGDVFQVTSHYLDIVGMGQYSQSVNILFFVHPDGSASVMEHGKPMTHKGGQLTPKEVESLFRRGGSRGLGLNTSLSDPKIVRRSRQASVMRVASLGDLTQFLKRADGKLVHKSTNDLWSYSKDADGNFLVERLFDDSGEPLKG